MSNLVVKNEQVSEKHGCVFIVDNKHLVDLIFVCRFCLKTFRELLAENYWFKELRKCFVKTFLKEEE